MNRAVISGNITKMPEVSDTKNGTKVARFTIEAPPITPKADSFPLGVVAFGAVAEVLGASSYIGQPVCVIGQLQVLVNAETKARRACLAADSVVTLVPTEEDSEEAPF